MKTIKNVLGRKNIKKKKQNLWHDKKYRKASKKNVISFFTTHTYLKLLLLFIFSFTYFQIYLFPSKHLTKKEEIKIAYNKTYSSSTKVGLCIICKLENLYIKEFIDYYKDLGYNHIFIYDNNDKDGERLEDVIQKYIDEGFVSITDYRGDRNRPIFRAYFDCYEKNSKEYDWISFFDIDEFLVLKPDGIKIQEFLDNERYKDCQNIKVNWVLYSDDDKIYYENKPVVERFKTPLYNNILNNHVKSTVRGHLPINYWKGGGTPHSSSGHNYTCCNPSGEQISKSSSLIQPYDYKYALLRHYRTKTVEEYINKIKKGKPDAPCGVEYMMTMFFYTNKRTKEKIDYFNKEFPNKTIVYN